MHQSGRSKINDLNLVVVFILLEQYVLRFQISMDDIIYMDIVHCHKQLPHEYCGLLLRELSSVHNIVKKFSTLTDFCHYVVAFLVFKKLVELYNVGVVKRLQNFDFRFQGGLLIFVHHAELEDLDCSLNS
jgi:hypothetical protein